MAYYEQQCSREQQEVYHALLSGLAAFSPSIRVPLLSGGALGEVCTRLRLDHPEIFYLTSFRLRYMPGAENGDFIPEYLFDKGKLAAHRAAIEARTARLIREYNGKNDTDKAAFLHRFITEKVHYDKLKKPYSHEIIGPLTQGVGVCEGIAKTVKRLAEALHMECIVALSPPEEGSRYGHAWNVIKCNGQWYHFDATFDLALSREEAVRFDYFLLSDAQIYRDHRAPLYPVPACRDNSAFYYRTQKLSFTKEDELARRIAQAAKKKKGAFVFHWRGDYLTRERLMALAVLAENAARGALTHARLSVNRSQAVFAVHFSDAEVSPEPALESAEPELSFS